MLKDIDIDGIFILFKQFLYLKKNSKNLNKGDGTFSFDEFVQLMYNMGNLSEISEEQEEAELRDAFKVDKIIIFL